MNNDDLYDEFYESLGGKVYEGTGYKQSQLDDMFNEWLEERECKN